jgi:copper resistance protein B
MKILNLKVCLTTVAFLFMQNSAQAGMGDDPLLTKVMSEFEFLPSEGDGALEWDINAWAGRDLYKVWIKSSGELSKPNNASTEVEDANIELVYSHAVYTNWDQQFGVRHDVKPAPDGNSRNWLSFGYIGTAPYFVDVDARVFLGEESSSQLLIELEKEIMLTQYLVLTPELNIVVNGRTNAQFNEGSGLAELEFSLRLGYEANGNRKFQPFVGFSRRYAYGGTERFEELAGVNGNDMKAIFGIHSWF